MKWAWKPMLEAAKVRHYKIHALRHFYASVQLSAGASVTYLQAQMGHHSAAFTLSVYCHLIPGDGAGAGARFEAHLDQARGVAKKVAINA
jgi:integrase